MNENARDASTHLRFFFSSDSGLFPGDCYSRLRYPLALQLIMSCYLVSCNEPIRPTGRSVFQPTASRARGAHRHEKCRNHCHLDPKDFANCSSKPDKKRRENVANDAGKAYKKGGGGGGGGATTTRQLEYKIKRHVYM
ncbi:hypothetical protein HBI65_200600 [Parastagonospora nodorum]|nr:hypothetical protein HBI65_200600 [Parastagonospora nodorum]